MKYKNLNVERNGDNSKSKGISHNMGLRDCTAKIDHIWAIFNHCNTARSVLNYIMGDL